MTPEQLKASILQYAIQGKLVEQKPEEGTAEELYQQIQAEKQRLIKEGKIKKDKPLPDIAEDEKPFDIPESWKWVRLGDLGSYKKGPFGSAITKSMFVPKGDGAIKVYEQKNAIQKDATLGDYYIRRDYYESQMKGFEIFPGDIIVSCAGTIGETYVMPNEFEQGIINQALMRMKIFEPMYIPYFLTFFDFVLKKNARSSSKGSAIKNIPPFEILKKYIVPIPPLAEQKRIVAKIEELLPLVDRYAVAYEKLEQFNAKFPEDIKKSILQYAIQGKLVEQRPEEGTGEELYQQIQAEKQRLIKEGKIKKEKPLPEIAEDEIPFDIPGNWKWVRLGSVVSVYGGKRIPVGRKLTIEDTGYAYIRVSDMKDGYVSTENLQFVPQDIYPSISRYIIGKEDVFITVAGTIGRVGKIPPELDGANLTENADRLVFSQLDQTWLIKCLQSSVVQSQIIDATTKVGQPKLAIVRIQNMMIPLPPLAEQKRIVAKLEEILPLCERLK